MYRCAMEELIRWKGNALRKPLIIEGARQVGKTWLMKEFGKTCYQNAVYINFDSNSQMQQLVTVQDINIYYYTNERGSCEIDFLIDDGESVIPVEAKAEMNLRAKSLKTYREKYSPQIAVRSALADYCLQDGLVNLPLYAIEEVLPVCREACMN